MSLILLIASLTLLSSFLCSLFEAALYAVTPSQVGAMERRGVRGARRLARLRENVEEPIAAILTVNTVAHTVGAAWCGALVGAEFGSSALGLFAGLFTVAVLVLTEIIPKSVGVRYATWLAPRIVWPLQLLIWSVWPVVWAARAVMRWLAGGEVQGPSKDEIVVVSQLAAEGGSVRSEEQRWVANALALDGISAKEICTPRIVVETLDADMTLREAVALGSAWEHSRVPIVEDGDPDRIVGLILRRDVYEAIVADPDTNGKLRELARPLHVIPEGKRGHELLAVFLRERVHIVAVVDEHGGFEGVVTLEDVLESLLGSQIVDEHDRVSDLRGYAKQRADAARKLSPRADAARRPSPDDTSC